MSQDGSGAAEYIKKFIADQKPEYNRFYYRLRHTDPIERANYHTIKESGTAQEAEDFISRISSGNARSTHLESCTRDTIEDEADTFMAWKKALDHYPEEVLIQMVRGGTIRSKRDEKIPASLAIEWPWYLKVGWRENKGERRV